jgi:predicted transcriptional regulator
MEVHLLESQEAQLNELALATGRGTDELVQEAVAYLLARSEWFKEQVQIGMDQIARGEFIEEEEMNSRVQRMLQRCSALAEALPQSRYGVERDIVQIFRVMHAARVRL